MEEAVLRALENNRSLAVERLEPLIARTDIEAEKADFDALHSATAGTDVSRSQRATGGELFLALTRQVTRLAGRIHRVRPMVLPSMLPKRLLIMPMIGSSLEQVFL